MKLKIIQNILGGCHSRFFKDSDYPAKALDYLGQEDPLEPVLEQEPER